MNLSFRIIDVFHMLPINHLFEGQQTYPLPHKHQISLPKIADVHCELIDRLFLAYYRQNRALQL